MLQILKTIMFLSLDISSYTPLDDLYDSDSGVIVIVVVKWADPESFSRGGQTFFTF